MLRALLRATDASRAGAGIAGGATIGHSHLPARASSIVRDHDMKIARIESFILGTGSSKDLLSTPRGRRGYATLPA
jgi:hypothetical protein